MVSASMGVLGSRESAHECASEAMAQVLQRRPADVVNLEAFMVTVAKRRAIDHHRAQVRSRRRDARLAGQTDVTVPDLAEDIAARAEARWVDEQARALLRPQVYSLVRLLADGMRLEEAANALGMTARSAESHLLRARRTVKAALAKTLALLAGVLACGRRFSVPAASTMTAAAATGLLFASPWMANGPGLDLRPVPATGVSLGHETSGESPAKSRDAAPGGRGSVPSARRSHSNATMSPGRRSETSVKTPVAGVRTYSSDDANHSDTPVEQVQHCVENLRVTISYVGCEKKP